MPFNIHVGDHYGNTEPDQHSVFSTPVFRSAIRLGLLIALVSAVINLVIFASGGGDTLEWSHMLIFLVLFLGIAYGMHSSRSWMGRGTAFQDRMTFGLLTSSTVAFFLTAINGLLALLDYNMIVSEVFLPINSAARFAVSSMGLFWGCLIFGFISALIMNFVYKTE